MPQFLTLTDVAEVLNVSVGQARTLVRTGQLQAIQVGGRGQWRIEAGWLDEYVERQRELTRSRVAERTREDAGHGA
ncbi:helix-turn-helix domain-containing protein [Micrococcus porci]|uniref:helix-turn-helix domain-containing protein n=1 Tax=Micrococcus TaxID=1269 RepID=UPI001CCD6492|nr:helix-turn-helix domain-containing protein [Micrococcus porci]MCG7423259.1 helix-turn-helix domain-containing protein [Micrococcus sp. ACRRV]UBH23608.1 helix-turn-helix domain-containing protein [Micrococcus porci]